MVKKILCLLLGCFSMSSFMNGEWLSSRLNLALKQEISEMARQDQEARAVWVQSKEEEDQEVVTAIDENHRESLKNILSRYGWPGTSLVDEEGSHNFWLLIQHTPDFELQKKGLALLEEAVRKQEASALDLAYLTDRVRMFEGKKQIYGTQFQIIDEKLVLYPIEDESSVDERRHTVGLGPLDEYVVGTSQALRLPLTKAIG